MEPLIRYAFPVTELPESTDLEAVCTIFETLNRTGKPLTTFELISAFAGGLSLYDYWAAAKTEHRSSKTSRSTPSTCSSDRAAGRRAGQASVVLSLEADSIEREWAPAVSDMAAALSMLRTQCGVLVGKWLPYRPMLIPLAVAWRRSPAPPDRSRAPCAPS